MIGAGGHAKVLASLVRLAGFRLTGVCDPALVAAGTTQWQGVPVLGDDDALASLDRHAVGIVNGIGRMPGKDLRRIVFERVQEMGFHFPALVHPQAWVDESVKLADGVQIMAGCMVQPDCSIGVNSVINTRAGIDHDCHVGAHVHIAPGTTLCGGVRVGDHTFVGTGSTIIQGVSVGANAMIAAGSLLTCDVPDNARTRSVPARITG
ncbi:acetyltransferase [Pandoraea sp. CB10b_02]|uniref:acetyltransferase n=1 Tax=Pandoraea sp. CB10b_02 TaxID=2014535 RepID=UPI00257DF6AD|nr:acetyltransferase [Pandoraea sp. CB10b_02]